MANGKSFKAVKPTKIRLNSPATFLDALQAK